MGDKCIVWVFGKWVCTKRWFAETSHTLMYMKEWIQKLDDFLKQSGKELLTHAGTISTELAKQKANTEYNKFKERSLEYLSPVEIHFLESFWKRKETIKEKVNCLCAI